MEGALWKWTNYWNGWQLRWFALDNDILSYYKSQEDVNLGCKGSMKVSTCEIAVHPHDNTRLNIVIPGEQHLYLRAPSSQDRQKWLVALGSAKACVTTTTHFLQPHQRHNEQPDSLRAKKSELRLYCDILHEQVHQMKEQALRGSDGGLDIEKLTEHCTTFGVTCDTFVKTLDECLQLAEVNFQCETPPLQHDISFTVAKSTMIAPPLSLKRSSSYDVQTKKT